jgi:hypothetical protein
VNTNVERKNTLLAQLAKKEITMDQLLYNCAVWAMEPQCWADIEVRQYPMPPKEWVEYQDLPMDKRFKVGNEFFNLPQVKEYNDLKGKVYAGNWGDYCWLKESKKHIPDTKENLHYHILLDEKIIAFRHWFEGGSEESDKAIKLFGGKVVENYND